MEVVLVNDSGTPDALSGQTGASEGAFMELTTALLAREDRVALARVSNRQRPADVAGILIYPGLATLLLRTGL